MEATSLGLTGNLHTGCPVTVCLTILWFPTYFLNVNLTKVPCPLCILSVWFLVKANYELCFLPGQWFLCLILEAMDSINTNARVQIFYPLFISWLTFGNWLLCLCFLISDVKMIHGCSEDTTWHIESMRQMLVVMKYTEFRDTVQTPYSESLGPWPSAFYQAPQVI